MSKPADKPAAPLPIAHDDLVDEVLQAAGGDARRAILELVLGQRQLEAEAACAVSAGYVRRELQR